MPPPAIRILAWWHICFCLSLYVISNFDLISLWEWGSFPCYMYSTIPGKVLIHMHDVHKSKQASKCFCIITYSKVFFGLDPSIGWTRPCFAKENDFSFSSRNIICVKVETTVVIVCCFKKSDFLLITPKILNNDTL